MKELSPKDKRRQQNLAIADRCFVHGIWYRDGIPQPPKENLIPITPETVFNMNGKLVFNGGKE